MKYLKPLLVAIAVIIALSYAFGYNYLFKAVRETYLRGETSSNINDGSYFPSHLVAKGTAKPWEKDSSYNTQKLPENVLKDLIKTETASLLVIKDGKLMHEEYWDDYKQESKTNSFSMAKAVTVMLLGKAIDDGKIKNLDQKYSTFYKNYANVPFGKNLTIRNLASMEAGLDWDESYKNAFKPNAKMYYGKSLAEAVFLKGFKEEPGKRYEYQSGATQLLGFAIRKAVNQPLSSYLSQKIWKPLGMESNANWTTDENGMEKTFCCIHGEARDFAKLGFLLLNKGKVDRLQILNPNFVQQMITPTKTSNETYGLGVWINHDNIIPYYFLWGLQGQYVIVIPEKQMIIVRTGSYKDQPKNDKGRPDQVKFLVNALSKIY